MIQQLLNITQRSSQHMLSSIPNTCSPYTAGGDTEQGKFFKEQFGAFLKNKH